MCAKNGKCKREKRNNTKKTKQIIMLQSIRITTKGLLQSTRIASGTKGKHVVLNNVMNNVLFNNNKKISIFHCLIIQENLVL